MTLASFASRCGRAAIACAWLAGAADPAAAGLLAVHASAASPTQIRVEWTFFEDPMHPAGHPEWTGYDLYRRTCADCGAWVRINTDVFPRVVGQTHTGSFLDTPPAVSTAYQYAVRPVDAARAVVGLGCPDCDPPCPEPAYATCPDFSAPLVVGTVSDLGWAVLLTPCPAGCWGSFYVEEPGASALRTHAGTGQVLSVYGLPSCGSVEGCALALDHFEAGGCGATPVRRGSWGFLKSSYR